MLRSEFREAARGALPLAFKARIRFFLASQTRANRSPPMPVDAGYTTFSAAAAATAPSTAFPPCISIRRPAMAANGWLVDTIPLWESTGERRELNSTSWSP